METNNNNKDYYLLDVLKLIFSLFVVAIHTKLSTNINNETIKQIFSIFSSCAVPFFFLCNGFFLAKKINFNNINDNELNKIKKELIKYIRLYLIWSLIYLPLALVEYFQTGNTFIYSFISYLKGFFIKGEHYNSWTLWYLLSLIYSILFIYFCVKKNITKKRIFTSFIFVCIGINIEELNINIFKTVLVLIGSLTIYFISDNFINAICMIFIVSSLFVLASKFYSLGKNKNISVYLRNISKTIYFIHMYVFTVYYYLVYGEPTYGIDSFLSR